jgi:hypothetical protein
MKVKELVKKLEKLEQEKDIFMSSDSEGNIINYISEIEKDHDNYIIYPTDDYIETVGTDISEEEYQAWLKELRLNKQAEYFKSQVRQDNNQK